MPPELEEVFTAAGAAAVPVRIRELAMRCSCPDSAVPCKHLAATFYLLAEAFDADPFQILHWRGKPKAELLDRVRALRSASDEHRGDHHGDHHGDHVSGGEQTGEPGETAVADQALPLGAGLALADLAVTPLADCLDRFWTSPHPLPARPVSLETAPDLLLRQLPDPSRRLGGTRLTDRLRPAYDRFRAALDDSDSDSDAGDERS